ncbi:MAG: hypothetical protein M1480_10555 [Bacteroidetes bacterium]|nr:hypothetical protein [Bacteroidota bacterium]
MKARNIKVIFFIIFILTSINQIFPQSELFKVIAVYGDAFVKDQKTNEWDKLSFGKKLNSSDIIKLGKNVYLGLVYKSGKTIELKKVGIYPVQDLANNIKQTNSVSMTYKFADFIYGEVSQKNSHGEIMDVKGAVMRGKESKDQVKLYLPRNSNIIDTTINFSWYSSGYNTKYYFRLSDKFDRIIYETETTDTLLNIDVSKYNLLEDNHYYWSVVSNKGKDSISKEYWFYILPKENVKMINDSLQQILSENDFEESLPCKFILACFYEQHKIFDKALKLFIEINTAKSNIEQYKNEYQSLIYKLGLTDKIYANQ